MLQRALYPSFKRSTSEVVDRISDDDTLPKAWCLPLHLEFFPEVKIAVSGEHLGRALPSTLNISMNYFRRVSVNKLKINSFTFPEYSVIWTPSGPTDN